MDDGADICNEKNSMERDRERETERGRERGREEEGELRRASTFLPDLTSAGSSSHCHDPRSLVLPTHLCSERSCACQQEVSVPQSCPRCTGAPQVERKWARVPNVVQKRSSFYFLKISNS